MVKHNSFYVLFLDAERKCFFINENKQSLKISMFLFWYPGHSMEKSLGLEKKDNCAKGLRLLCRRIFLLKLSRYMFE